jgi:hypothetical protein
MLNKLSMALAAIALVLASVSMVDTASASNRPDRIKDIRSITGLADPYGP